MMLPQVLIGCALILATAIIHAAGMSVGLHWLAVMHGKREHLTSIVLRSLVLGVLVLIMFAATMCEATVWAMAYTGIGAISEIEKAVYFSIVTYTTLGYGDVVLDESWRLLSSFQAANGIIIFGWTTAVLIVGLNTLSKSLSRFRTLD